MAKGIAHYGILFLLVFNSRPVSAMPVSEITAHSAAFPDARGERLEPYHPTRNEINRHGISIGDDDGDRHKIESDLLILPSQYLTLARSLRRELASFRYLGPPRNRGSLACLPPLSQGAGKYE